MIRVISHSQLKEKITATGVIYKTLNIHIEVLALEIYRCLL